MPFSGFDTVIGWIRKSGVIATGKLSVLVGALRFHFPARSLPSMAHRLGDGHGSLAPWGHPPEDGTMLETPFSGGVLHQTDQADWTMETRDPARAGPVSRRTTLSWRRARMHRPHALSRDWRLAHAFSAAACRKAQNLPGLDVRAHVDPAHRIGGDFYEVVPDSRDSSGPENRPGHWRCSGKGVAAALAMMMGVTLVRERACAPGSCNCAAPCQQWCVQTFSGPHDRRS